MSKYAKIQRLNNERFRRLTGVSKKTFEQMVTLLKNAESIRKKVSGRPCKICYEDQILMMLEYLREYRTYYHIGTNYQISESNAYRIIKRVEDILIKSEAFKLPTKNRLMSDTSLKIILIDATETPCERPCSVSEIPQTKSRTN